MTQVNLLINFAITARAERKRGISNDVPNKILKAIHPYIP